MTANLFEHTHAHWAKYSDYEWRTASDGYDYLLPTADAKLSVYDPIQQADALVVETVNIGLLLFHKASDSKLKEAMLSFAHRYGLLGLMTALPTTPRFVEYEKVYLPKNPYIRQETMETQDYLRFFFPFAMPDFHKRGIESLWQISGEDRMQIALAITFRDEPQAKAMSFMRGYGERFDWLKEVFRDWAFAFTSAYLYEHDRKCLDRNAQELYRQGIACFEGNVPGYHLELRDHPVMVWDFHSLLLTIRFFFSLGLTDTKNPLKMCEHCQRAFIARRADSRFCSDDCRKRYKAEE